MTKIEKAHQLLASRILDDFIGKITGGGLDRIVTSNPENVLLVGKLMSTHDHDESNANSSKTFIESIGADFNISDNEINNAMITLFPQGDFYYRATPTLSEQQYALLKEINSATEKDHFETFDDVAAAYSEDPARFSKAYIKLTPVYKKTSIDKASFSLVFALKDLLDETGEFGFVAENHTLNRQLSSHLQELQEEINQDTEAMTRIVLEPTRVEHLLNEETYQNFLQNYATKKVQQQNQNWQLYFDITIKKIGSQYLVSISLVNNSIVLYSGSHRTKKDDKFTIETLFNSGIKIELSGASFCPIELDFFADDYKYDKTQYALSNNCAIEFIKDENALQTNHLPLYEQYRLIDEYRVVDGVMMKL